MRTDHDTEASRSDVEIVAAINGGDAAAFEVLYFRHRDWVAGLAYRFTGDSDASLDVRLSLPLLPRQPPEATH